MIFFTVLSVLLVPWPVVYATNCADNQCTGPFRLVTSPLQHAPVSNEKHHATVHLVDEQTTGVVAYRSRYTAYCYEGGPGDPNTGCYKEHTYLPPQIDEIRRWVSKGKCFYGVECEAHGECWGGDSNACLDKRTEVNSATTKEYNGNLEEWRLFARHTCISTWRCGMHSSKFPVYLEMTEDGVSPFTYGPKGQKLRLSDPFASLDKETVVYFPGDHSSKQLELWINCYKSDGQETVCQLPHDKRLLQRSGAIFILPPEGALVFDNIGIIVTEQEHPNDTSHAGEKGTSAIFKKTRVKEAASIEDLKPIIISMIFEASETNYNLFQLLKGLTEVTSVLKKTVESVAKLDDELVGKILGIQSKTKWFNEHLFHMCPCFPIDLSSNGNCHDNFIYQDGRYRYSDTKDQCSSFSNNSITQIQFMQRVNLTFSHLEVPPARGTLSSWEGWSWLADQKQNLLETMAFKDESTSPGSGNPLSQLYNEGVKAFSFWNLWSRYTPFLNFIALALSIYNFIKR